MHVVKLRRLLGLAGVSVTETYFTQNVGKVFEWFMLAIAFWLPIQWYLQLQNQLTVNQVVTLDWFVWAAFMLELIVLGTLVKKKTLYFTGNWLNLFIIIVACPIFYEHFTGFGMLRMVRLLILARIILPWMRSAHNMLTLNRVGLSLVVFFVATSLSGVIVSTFDSGISNPLNGIWWAWETVTTVGYGDIIPTTPAGKVIAMVVMVLGIILFSIVTASVSAYFMGRDKSTELYNIIELNHKRLGDMDKCLRKLASPTDFDDRNRVEEFVQRLTPEQRQLLRETLNRFRCEDSGVSSKGIEKTL